MKWLTRFLWRQIQWALWIGIFFGGGYIIQQYFHQFWAAGGVMLFIAVMIAIAWILSLFNSDSWDMGSGGRRENPFEVQRKEFEEDMNAYQREQEDRHS